MNERIETSLERLLIYGLEKQLFSHYDTNEVRNRLIEILKIEDYKPEQVGVVSAEGLTIDEILKPLLDYAANADLLLVDTLGGRDLMDAKLMGALMPRPSQVIGCFFSNYEKSPELATNVYYQMSLDSNYIRKSRTDKNKVWRVKSEFGEIDITINLSKPEKDPKEIEAEKYATKASYPKCLLCAENEGYMGRMNHPARQNHRMIPLVLGDEPWYLQYSPYAYYNEHAIVLSQAHRPMKIEEKTFERLLDFVHYLPHYFVGSNADLPIVGGSILSHDHFQGGHYHFPMERAAQLAHFRKGEIDLAFIRWPLSVLRLSGTSREALVREAGKILEAWRQYSDMTFEILSHSGSIPHNTITPVARFKAGRYELDLVLRNNRTSDQYPEGIFHTHSEIHGVKKENIGLIEVMGLAVLPARLEEEMKIMRALLAGEVCTADMLEKVEKHRDMLADLKEKMKKEAFSSLEDLIQNEVGTYFVNGLRHCGVYPPTANGVAGVRKFLEPLGWQ